MSSLLAFYRSTVGKKAVMAVTGGVLFTFVVGHMLGNLQIFLGAETLNHYAEFLKSKPALLWGARITLLATISLHIATSLSLTLRNNAARPEAYAQRKDLATTYAARSMIYTGPIIAAFVVYHLLHFTIGSVGPAGFDAHDVYGNVVRGFRVPAISAAYIAAMLLLGMHLYHGLWSALQTIGASHPKYNGLRKTASALAAVVIAGGNISIPVSILLGLVK